MADIRKALAIAPIAAIAAMVVGIGFTLASAWFFFVTDPEATSSGPVAAAPMADAWDVAVDEVVALHLFGRSRARPGGAADIAATENLRETRLSLDLVGVFVADVPDESRALIAQQGRDPEAYGPGDRLPGNAKLVDVYWNRVVISRAGQHELIRFEHDTDSIQPVRQEARVAERAPRRQGAAAVESARAPPPRGPVEGTISRYREEFAQSPEELLSRVDAAVGLDGSGGRSGYLVGALADLPALGHAGLQPGDRILSVNGRSVGDPRPDALLVEDFLAEGAARLEIQRGERRFVVTVPVN